MEEKSDKKFSVWISWCHDESRQHRDALEYELKKNAAEEINVFSSAAPGQSNWRTEIATRIPQSDAYLLLVSRGFQGSGEIEKELELINNVDRKGREIFLLLVESCELPKADGDRKLLQRILEDEDKHLESLGAAECPQYKNERPHLSYEDMALKILNHFKVKLRSKDDGPLHKYAEAIAKGCFVPYIGPDCYGLRDEWQPHLGKLSARLDNISKRLEAVSAENLAADRNYLKAVALSHNPYVDFNAQLLGGADTGESDNSALFKLRVAVARAGAAASRLLGKSLGRCEGLIDAKAYRVVITDVSDPDVAILRKNLDGAAEKAAEWGPGALCPARGDWKTDCMGPGQIAKKLVLFRKAVIKSSGSGSEACEVRLSLSQLDWLGDLLWHLLRYNLPIYLKPDELAFRLTLCQSTKYFARIPFGTTAAIWAAVGNANGERGGMVSRKGKDEVTLVGCSQSIHAQMEKKNESRSTPFYWAIAKLLWNSYESFMKLKNEDIGEKSCEPTNLHKGDSPDDSSSILSPAYRDGVRGQGALYPMAVSMNFDEEIENCLKSAQYSVLYPVRTDSDVKTTWLLRVHDRVGKDKYYVFPDSCESSIDLEGKLRGPLIVKYRGAPLQDATRKDLESIAGPIKPDLKTEAKNRLLLSSLDYAAELSDTDLGEPKWLKQQLDDPARVKCFLGYPLDDIDGILGIQRNVWVGAQAESKERISVGCRHRDGVDSELLTGLRVKPLDLDLDDFASTVDKFREFTDVPGETKSHE